MENFSRSKGVGLFFASISVFIWGITFVCTKYLLRSFSAFEILFLRFLLAYLALWILRPRALRLPKKNEIYFALAGFSGVTAYQLMENMAISYTSASNVSIIVSICPIFAAIFSQIFLREKILTPAFILGFVLAIFGVALVSFNGVVEFHLSPAGKWKSIMSFDSDVRAMIEAGQRLAFDTGSSFLLSHALIEALITLPENALEKLGEGKRLEMTVTYFIPDPFKPGGRYETVTEKIRKIDTAEQKIILDRKVTAGGAYMEILIPDILEIRQDAPEGQSIKPAVR